MNARAYPFVTAQVIPLPTTRRRLAEASIVPLAKDVAAIMFDAPPDRGNPRERLTALFDGKPLGRPAVSTSLELRSGGRRHVLMVGRSAASLTGTTVTLALGTQLAAVLDGDWLQPPIADGAALVRGLAETGRRRLLKLFLTTGASLFGRGSPEFAGAARGLVETVASASVEPICWRPIGAAGAILSYVLPTGDAAPLIDEVIELGTDKVTRVAGWDAIAEAEGRLHLFIPGRVTPGASLVGLGTGQLHLRTPDVSLPPRALAPWLAKREPAVRAWAEALLAPAAMTDAAAAALVREIGQPAGAAPKAILRHLSGTRGGVLYAVELDDPAGLVRSVRIERGDAVEDAEPQKRLAGFARLGRTVDAPDRCRVSLVHHSGRLTIVHDGALECFRGDIPPALAAFRATAPVAEARFDLPRSAPTGVERFGDLRGDPPLSLVCAVDQDSRADRRARGPAFLRAQGTGG